MNYKDENFNMDDLLDRVDLDRKAKAENEAIENSFNHWNSLNDIEKLDHIDFMTNDHRKWNCECTLDNNGLTKYINLICYKCKFVRDIKKTKPNLLKKYRWVRPESHFII